MSGYNFPKICLKIFFTFTNSEDPDEMHFIGAFTVCKSTRLGVSSNTKGINYLHFISVTEHITDKQKALKRDCIYNIDMLF